VGYSLVDRGEALLRDAPVLQGCPHPHDARQPGSYLPQLHAITTEETEEVGAVGANTLRTHPLLFQRASVIFVEDGEATAVRLQEARR
jgi:hypothetical protein